MISVGNLRKGTSGRFFHLSLLHIFNDGFQASFVLLLPFIAKDQSLNLTKVGLLGTILNVSGIILAIPAGNIAAKIGGFKTLGNSTFYLWGSASGGWVIGSL